MGPIILISLVILFIAGTIYSVARRLAQANNRRRRS